MRRSLILFATLLLLWAIVAELNHAVSSWHLWIFAGGLFVCYPALTQPLRRGLALALAAGFVCDANSPVALGTHVLLFAAAHVVVYRLRDRVPREDNVAATLLVLFVNFGLFLGLTFAQARHSGLAGALWPRLLSDLVFSQVLIAFVTPWFFALQARALALSDTLAVRRTRHAA